MANTTENTLFPLPEPSEPAAAPAGRPRLRLAERAQITRHCESLDQRLPEQHLARDIWSFVTNLALTPLLDKIRAVEGQTGRDATDPRILMSIWLLAFAESHSSAREVAELCRRDRAYEWLCGGVSINHHLLSDFRVAHRDYLNQLFTDTLATFLHEGLLDLHATAQDGMRVRASAGKASFRRQATLEVCLGEAQEHVARLDRELENGTTAERAARERAQRVRNALDQVQELARQREARTKGSGEAARGSTTDPDARNMKMADGGFRPACNVQYATDGGSGLIVGVDVTNQGTDAGLMDPMLAQIGQRTGRVPQEHLADGGFATLDDLEKVHARGTTVYTPVKDVAKKQAAGIDPYQRQEKDSEAIGAWRERMGTAQAKETYKRRAQTAEWTNAQARNRDFYAVGVRGRAKVLVIALWFALVHNLLTAWRLRKEKAQPATSPPADD